uniref:Nudix hydrolase domain-containing protein n=1 Tax=Strongyloides papillosus TaxID=174720 RepID=A0A0N5BNA2_STREA
MTSTKNTVNTYLDGYKDRYDGLTIHSNLYKHLVPANILKDVLEYSEDEWKKKDYKGIWIKVDIEQSDWVPILTKFGFKYHHAQENFVMLTKWLPKAKKCTIPRYPFTTIGVGGITVNSKGQILLMREKRGHYLGWKFPGGLHDYGEDIEDTAVREVKEETGVETVPEGVLCFRHTQQTPYSNCSDIYFIVSLKPKDESKININICPDEAAAAGWFSREEIKAMSDKEIHNFHLHIIELYDNWKKTPCKVWNKKNYYIPKLNKHWSMYYSNDRKNEK